MREGTYPRVTAKYTKPDIGPMSSTTIYESHTLPSLRRWTLGCAGPMVAVLEKQVNIWGLGEVALWGQGPSDPQRK